MKTMQVTSRKDQMQYWARRDVPYRFVTVKEFSEAFQSFHEGKRLGNELAVPFDKSKNHPAALTTKKYGVNKRELCKASFAREFLLMKRNSFVYAFKFIQVGINFCQSFFHEFHIRYDLLSTFLLLADNSRSDCDDTLSKD